MEPAVGPRFVLPKEQWQDRRLSPTDLTFAELQAREKKPEVIEDEPEAAEPEQLDEKTERPSGDAERAAEEEPIHPERAAARDKARETIAGIEEPRDATGKLEDVEPEVLLGAEQGRRIERFGQQTIAPVMEAVDKIAPMSQWNSRSIERKALKYAPAVTAVATQLAHNIDPNLPEGHLTLDEVREMSPGLRVGSKLLGKKLGGKLERYAERVANEKLNEIVETAEKAINLIGSIRHPRQQLTDEVADLYGQLKETGLPPSKYFRKVGRRVDTLAHGYDASLLPEWCKEITAETHPMLVGAEAELGVPIGRYTNFYESKIDLAGPEIVRGLAWFLMEQRVPNVPRPDFVEAPDTAMRGLAETFGGNALGNATRTVVETLHTLVDALPKNGPATAESMRQLVMDMAAQRRAKVPDEEIVEKLFAKRLDPL